MAGRAAKMGHRLTIAMQSWHAAVRWTGGEPKSTDLTVAVDSLFVVSAEGGVTPLVGPQQKVARSNALKTLEASRYPRIRFAADDIAKTSDGYRLSGTVEIHGTSRAQVVDLRVDDRADGWSLSTRASITQRDFGVKPYSLFMGSFKVADEVTIDFVATYPK